jgi:hypothetical protein
MTAAAPVCWSCGEVGVHGSVDECLAALRIVLDTVRPRCAPIEAGAPSRKRPPLMSILVIRLQPGGHRHLCYRSRSLADALRWLADMRKVRDGRHYLEHEGEPATLTLAR